MPTENRNQPIILSTSNLQKSFGGQKVINGVNIQLRRGEVVLLRGPNGSGKTTLLNMLTGNILPDKGQINLNLNKHKDAYLFPKSLRHYTKTNGHFSPEAMARKGIGRSWQEMRLFSTLSLRDNISIAFPNQIGETPVSAIINRNHMYKEIKRHNQQAEAILNSLGLGERSTSSADMVSLGQAKRVAIARAVHGGAKILFLDEPLAGLDPAGVVEIMSLLEHLVNEKNVTLVIIEHVFNMPLVLSLAKTVWSLNDGKLSVETPNEALKDIQNILGDGIQTWLHQVSGSNNTIKECILPGGAKLLSVRAKNYVSNSNDDVVLEIKDLKVHRNGRRIFGDDKLNEGITFNIKQGHITVLQAPNGWGKTTLLDAITGILPISQGQIKLLGRDVTRMPTWQKRRQGISFLQSRDHVFPALTTKESLKLASITHCPPMIKDIYKRKVSTLSGGEKQKLAITCAIHGDNTPVLLLDEPFSALDTSSISETWSYIESLLPVCGILIVMPGAYQISQV